MVRVPEQLTTAGGITGAAIAVVYVGRLILDWYRERKTETPKAAAAVATAQVSDAATANAVLVATVQSLQAENARLAGRVQHLEDEADERNTKITQLEGQLAAIAAELASLRSSPHKH